MDDTHQNRKSDAAAAATRKRRSSILKSQRPPRTPFSELEFHVTTPPDTTKSRRVSFSRRTGVAEFVTNEATTTWKNFYEEHNKSMESSGNESGMNAPKQSIGHLGKRIFDQQFQEVMAVDVIADNDNLSIRNVNSSFNNINLTQQLASLECTNGTNLSIPQQKFEMSAATDHQSKFFDDLAPPTIGEMSGKIDINFSTVQIIGTGEIKDDLDEIQQDLQRARSNIVCGGPFSGGRDMSEYIEVDLNATHVTIPNDVSDMSITDTIRSPKVQDVSKSTSINKSSSKKDWIEDKENIGAYGSCSIQVAPSNERRNTVVYENDTGNISITQAVPTAFISPEEPESDRRKTIVYESDAADISVTQALPVEILIVNKDNEKRKTILYENDTGNVSVTQAIPTNIILPEITKTIISDDDFGNISITQAVPSAKIISERAFGQSKDTEKRKTIVYENEAANISETQGVPPNIISAIERKSNIRHSPVKSEQEISFSNMELSNKRKTIVFDDDINNISVTQAVPANIIENAFGDLHKNNSSLHNRSSSKNRTFDLKFDNVSTNKRNTIVFDDDINNISSTPAIPANLFISRTSEKDNNAHSTNLSVEIKHHRSISKEIPLLDDKTRIVDNRRRTVVFEKDNENANMSITEAIPHEKLIKEVNITNMQENNESSLLNLKNIVTDTRRRTVVFEKDNEDGNMSITQALPKENLLEQLTKISLRHHYDVSQLGDQNITTDTRRRTVVFEKDNENADMSITQAIPRESLLKELNKISSLDEMKNNENISLLHLNMPTENKLKTLMIENDNQDANSSIDSMPIGNLTSAANKTDALEPTISNRSTLLNNSYKKKLFESHREDINMSINITASEEYLIEDMKNKKPQQNNFSVLDLNEKNPYKPNTPVFEKANESMFKSMTDNLQDDFVKDIKYDDIYDMSMSKPAQAKSTLMKLGKSIVTELNRSDIKYQINHSSNKPISQDIFVYQAVTQNDDIVKSSNSIDPQIDIDAEELEQKSPTKSFSKESNIETDKSIQLSQVYSLQQEADTNEDKHSSTALKQSILTSLSSTKVSEKSRKAILDDLLDMSSTSLATNTDKNIATSEDMYKTKTDNISSDSLIQVRDSDCETQTENNEEDKNQNLKYETSLPLKCRKETNFEVDDIKEKLSESKDIGEDRRDSSTNRIYEEIRSSALFTNKPDSINKRESIHKSDSTNNTVKVKLNITKAEKSVRDANDTNDLLEMLSDLTDKSRVLKDEERPGESIKNMLEYPEANEPRRRSMAPNRLSIVISREDLLNNISMAHAALQRSIEIDESLADTSITPEEKSPSHKSNRVSNEVAKKLHFEDESDSETNVKASMKTSPLKKTVFGQSEYMKDIKTNVIPSYLKDVSDELKSLMDDLVKPNADPVPYQTLDKCPNRAPSTCSTQIQANLITSSQIEIDTEDNSVVESTTDADKESLPSSDIGSKSLSSSAKTLVTEKRVSRDVSFPRHLTSPGHSRSDRVITFDHLNPLNNILLAPPDNANVHKYYPSPNETLCEQKSNQNGEASSKEEGKESHNVTAQYNVGSVLLSQSLKQTGDTEMIADTPFISDNSKIGLTRVCELKDTKTNTVIAMKGNKELLVTSSSLTLVDDALAPIIFEDDSNSAIANSSSSNTRKSPVNIIYKIDDLDIDELDNKDSDLTSNDEKEPVKIKNKPKKRIYSPSKTDKHQHSGLDTTPKPISKMLRMSNSPKSDDPSHQKLKAEKDVPDPKMDVDIKIERKNSLQLRKKSKSPKKPGTNVTVQQLITEYDIKDGINRNVLNKQILDSLSRSDISTAPNTVSGSDVNIKSLDIVNSFTSSKNQHDLSNACSVTTMDTVSSVRSRLEWQTVNVSSKNSIAECESSVNVVAKIDMLPFMGSHQCEWEASDIDTWSFRLLHGRLRLSLRLAHRNDNASRTRVRADTPILAVTLETTHADKKNSVAMLCVGFAAEAMRYFIGQGCVRAGDVPPLLRRCAAVARVALRWGRAMHEARLQLAYTLLGDGGLALKVANVPLRSVWEVTMRLELVVEDAREAPWPRACDVRVTRVVSDVRVTDEEMQRVLAHLPRDWGHAPRALWKIFRYLKNKTRDEEILGLT